jgi:hypothetical protein
VLLLHSVASVILPPLGAFLVYAKNSKPKSDGAPLLGSRFLYRA